MKVAVWDTYVTRENGMIMHFDIIVPELKDETSVLVFLKEYLQSKNKEARHFVSKECSFCHVENSTPQMEQSILQKGYYILEMQGCE